MPRNDFAAFILTHGRPERVYTYETLRRSGYTGRIVVLIDDEDEKRDAYRKRFGAEVEIFDKRAVAARIDEADNFADRRAVVYARIASFDVARALGVSYFVQLDDDYVDFRHKRNGRGEYIHKREIRDLDAVFEALLEYFISIPALSVAIAQGGDFIGGAEGNWNAPRRKAMNSFFCSVDRPIAFAGRVNEDVSAYVLLGSRGGLFITTPNVALQQKQTQEGDGGMTELYLDSGTYVKSFYSVIHAPSAVSIGVIPSVYARIHHHVHWQRAVPKILRAEVKKTR